MSALEIVQIKPGTSLYEHEVNLRHKVLLKEVNIQLTASDLEREVDHIHLGALCDDQLVGCLILMWDGPNTIRMRQVAVDRSFQGKGIGRKLVEESETIARELEAEWLTLHAREGSMPFYFQLGYEVFGEPFIEVGLPHRKMRKALASQGPA